MTANENPSAPLAVITGGSRGLGRSMATHLAARGINSVITYRSAEDRAREVVAEVETAGAKAVALQLDVSDTATFDAFAAKLIVALRDTFGQDRFTFLVNNAGSGVLAPIALTTEAQLDAMFNEHLKGPFFLTQKLLPQLADGGRILNISSGLTRMSLPGSAPYAMMKGGLEVFTRYLAVELGERRISVNTLAPGAIATDFRGGAVRDNADLNRFIASQTPLGRVGEPDDIGAAVDLLLAPGAHWINGQRIEASGGMRG